MVTKRQVISEIENNMASRNIGDPSLEVTPAEDTEAGRVSVRFDEGDYEKLKIVAAEQGLSALRLSARIIRYS
jgi:hypothetical protein